MKSIQTKIVSLIMIGIIVSALVIGGVGIISFEQVLHDDSEQIMNLKCTEQSKGLNHVLERMEQSVKMLSVYATDNLESMSRLKKDKKYRKQYTGKLRELGETIANETDGSVAVYARFDPNLTSSKEGFFQVKNKETGKFEDTELTDISKYKENDVEHVGWYYLPVKKGAAMWLRPYQNNNIDIYMISYVIPVYFEKQLLGIVGMDIDFGYITSKVDAIQIYETGSAFLANQEYKVIHSKNQTEATGEKMKTVYHSLKNDMCLGVTVPVSEIDRNRNKLVAEIFLMTLVIVLIFILVARTIAKAIVRPLISLNVAAKEIAAGNLDVSLACDSKDEVGALSESLTETVNQLKSRIDYINELAYIDILTGIKNNTAYSERVNRIKADIESMSFAVFVIDVNGLKTINDLYGHDYGNNLLIYAAQIVVRVFGQENVYRIGGDEFAVILEQADDGKCRELEEKFEKEQRRPIGEMKVSAAIGSAVYDKEKDPNFDHVFKRADGRMYEQKSRMKQKCETSMLNESRSTHGLL